MYSETLRIANDCYDRLGLKIKNGNVPSAHCPCFTRSSPGIMFVVNAGNFHPGYIFVLLYLSIILHQMT